MYGLIITIHIIACSILIAAILLQSGRGGGLSDLFGAGTAQTIFGTRAPKFLTSSKVIPLSPFSTWSLITAKVSPFSLSSNLSPIICVGERLEEREKGETFAVIKDHVEKGLKGITLEEVKRTVLAYEPVWAIGTGRTATPDEAQEAHSFIRTLLNQLYNKEVATLVRIQYGGSVKPANIADLMAKADVDGALVGGASLKLDSFVKIVKTALSHKL